MSTSIISKQQHVSTAIQKLTMANEQTWLTIGSLAEMMMDDDKALRSYESALKHNPYSIAALTQIAALFQKREQYKNAMHYYKRIISIQENHGETWTALGHCHLMMDQLQEAYGAYQQALYHLNNPKDPKLWYGIGILYDRYDSLDHAEEAFSAILKMDPEYEKKLEVYFRLGVIYKKQEKLDLALQCFQYLLDNQQKSPTVPEADVWYHLGFVYEQQKQYGPAKEAYEKGLKRAPQHAQLLQQLGWLYHHENNISTAIQYLTESLKIDNSDAQSWYLLGRCYMAGNNYNKAYEAYQAAVERDSSPIFWCSIGVLYFQIHQFRDALDAYSKAIRLNPHMSEVWYNLGTLYESCQNQVQDALDAYQRAAELDPLNPQIKQRLDLLQRRGTTAHTGDEAPVPQDVMHPGQFQSNHPLDHSQRDHKQQEMGISRDLPVLSSSGSTPAEKHQHIPDITATANSSPTTGMNSMMIAEDGKKEPKSPHPTSALEVVKEENQTRIKDEDTMMED